jgi:hypothetical protein
MRESLSEWSAAEDVAKDREGHPKLRKVESNEE